MKAYIIYIATLLAALALPANGQNAPISTKAGADTKAAPDVPSMPYRLSMTLTGSAHGKVTVAATKPGEATGTYYPLTADSLVYGAPNNSNYTPGKNAAEVKISVVPDPFYEFRDGYPKVYPTGKPTETMTTSGDDDANGNPYRTFCMPASPITVEMAYAIPVDSLIDISLKAPATDITAALALLPRYVPITLVDGRKDSLKVADTDGWMLNESSYDSKAGAVNEFKVSFSLPDSLYEASTFKDVDGVEGMFWDYIKVANKAESLKPAEADKDKGITISGGTGDNLNGQTEGETDSKPFDGTIGGDTETTVKSLEVGGDVKDATLTLNNISVNGGTEADANKTTIKEGANVTIKLEGNNILGNLTVDEGASLILQPEAKATLTSTKIKNGGIFIDSTATVSKVEGTGALDINGTLTGGGSVEQGSAATATLTASTTSDDKAAGTTFFTWQKKNTDGTYTDIQTKGYDENGDLLENGPLLKRASAATSITDTYKPATTTVGSIDYRCLIRREIPTAPGAPSGTPPVVTLLSTTSKTVTVTEKSDPTPPTPVCYTVTLPSLTGATTDPDAGDHEVKSGDSFSFLLLLDKDYDQSTPLVSTSDGKTITPRKSDNKYVISSVTADLSVTITGIVKNAPTANEEITVSATRVWGSRGVLHISQPTASKVTIYTFGGALLKSARLPAGDTRTAVPAGSYVVMAGNSSFKVIIQ